VTHTAIGAGVSGGERISKGFGQERRSQPRTPSQTMVEQPPRHDFFIATLAAAGIAAHLGLRYGFNVSVLAQFVPLYFTLILGGLPLLVRLIRKVFEREFGSDLLAGLSIVVSALMGQYLVGSIVVLMLSGGTALETFATRRASSVLKALAQRMPQNSTPESGKRDNGH